MDYGTGKEQQPDWNRDGGGPLGLRNQGGRGSGGKNSQLKGVVHEILYRDSLTVAPKNLASGAKGALSKSVTAMRDDVLLKQGGSVVAGPS